MTRLALTVAVCREDPWTLDARTLLDELSATLALFQGRSNQSPFCISDVCTVRSAFMLARAPDGNAVGCGAFRRASFGTAEVTGIYSRHKQVGVGEAILVQLESGAAAAGYHTLRVNVPSLGRAAISFFVQNGFRPTSPLSACVTTRRRAIMVKKLRA